MVKKIGGGENLLILNSKKQLDAFLSNSENNIKEITDLSIFYESIDISFFTEKLILMKKLKSLTLNFRFNENHTHALAEGLAKLKKLKILDLKNTYIGDIGIEILSKIKGLFYNLNSLRIGNTNITYKAINSILESLKRDAKMTRVIDPPNSTPPKIKGTSLLGKGNKNTQELNETILSTLFDSGIMHTNTSKTRANAMNKLGNYEGFTSSITELDISSNKLISIEAFKKLFNLYDYTPSLLSLNISDLRLPTANEELEDYKELLKLFCDGLYKLKNLKDINVSGIILINTDEKVKMFIKSLHKTNQINRVNIAVNTKDVLTSNGVLTLLESFEKLTYLNLNNIDNHKSVLYAEKFAQHLGRFIYLEELHINNNDLTRIETIELEKTLGNLTSLKVLDISQNNICYEGAKAFTPCLLKMKKLTDLNVSDNHLGLRGVIEIVKVLKNHESIKSLNIGGRRIANADFPLRYSNSLMEKIASELSNIKGLKKLDLNNNKIPIEGGITLSNCFKNLPNLTYLNISNNNLDYVGTRAILDSLSNNQMTYLDISNNNVFRVYYTDEFYETFRKLTTLKTLICQNNNINIFIAEKFINKILSHLKSLEVFDISGNPIVKKINSSITYQRITDMLIEMIKQLKTLPDLHTLKLNNMDFSIDIINAFKKIFSSIKDLQV
jgi:Ran GTPase-activating protein (RanGAP) involved in mRNA processing and transport